MTPHQPMPDEARAPCRHPPRTSRADVSDADAGADRARRPARAHPEGGRRMRCCSRSGRPSCRSSWSPQGQVEIVRPAGRRRDADRRARPGRVHRRGQHALGPPLARPGAGDRSRARSSSWIASSLLSLVQTDTELSEILMRAFILRRVELIAQRARRRRARRVDALRRHAAHQGVPDAQRPSLHVHRPRSRRRRAGRCSIASTSAPRTCPVLICRGDVVLRNPTNRQIADCLGFNDAIDADATCATWSSSAPARRAWRRRCTPPRKGWTCWSSRSNAPGGQAGSSSKIENYLGFPTGISGPGPGRPRLHAGAEVRRADRHRARARRELACERRPYAVEIDDDRACRRARSSSRPAPTTGGSTSRTSSQFEGAGVYYGATFIEAQLCGGEEVIVVGGGNSAGQAAVFLAQTARRVHMLVRAKRAGRDACRAI